MLLATIGVLVTLHYLDTQELDTLTMRGSNYLELVEEEEGSSLEEGGLGSLDERERRAQVAAVLAAADEAVEMEMVHIGVSPRQSGMNAAT